MIYAFDLLPESGHRFPAFVNLQQYYVEALLADRAAEVATVRWRNRVAAVEPRADGVRLRVDTPDGEYSLDCDWLIAADGVKSVVRRMLGLEPVGQAFHDRFLIADVKMKAEFPTERWFWFDPPFHDGRSALLHRQADDVWRIDLQLGPDVDPEVERRPDRVLPRVRAMLGEGVSFELEWVSVYTFRCRRLDRFRHGHVLFAGDSAHEMSPFGARGGNGGVQDADNLGWKLDLVARGVAPASLLDSYDAERIPAADENLRQSTRTTDFIAAASGPARSFRDAALALAASCPFARRMVNAGRLSVPFTYRDSPLSTEDEEPFAGAMTPGAPSSDAPVGESWLLPRLGGGFHGLYFAGPDGAPDFAALRSSRVPVEAVVVRCDGVAAERYDARPGTFYLVRPDQHVAGRWRRFDRDRVLAAVDTATGCDRKKNRTGSRFSEETP
jgi:3-(3-hydroxy-phenyl)propionate hydroxylase